MNSNTRPGVRLAVPALLILLAGCGDRGPQTLATLTFEDSSGLLALCPEATLDTGVDGSALLIDNMQERVLVNICEPTGPRGKAEVIVVGGRVRTELLRKKIFLDLWIFPRDGEPRLARSVLRDIRQTTPWTDFAVRVPLKADERPDKLRVAIYTEGQGRIWLDDLVVRAGLAADFDGGR